MVARAGEFGATAWREFTQTEITSFARLTCDDHWIRVDEKRTARDMPGGRTIAHGLFLLALVPWTRRDLLRIARRGAGLHDANERAHFTAPVEAGSRMRLRQRLIAAVPQGTGTRLAIGFTFDIEGAARPELVATGVLLIADA